MRQILSIVALWCCSCVLGQGAWNIGMRGSWGWLAPHHSGMWFLVEEHALMGKIFYERPFSGKLDWHRDHGYPSWGAGLMMTDAGSPHHLGTVVRLLPYLELPLVNGGRTELHCRVGWGLGWVQHPFDRLENYQQNTIGSHINAAILLALEARHAIGRTTLGLGLSLDHQSNGSLQVPNLGINLLTANLSVRRWFGDTPRRDMSSDSLVHFDPSWRTEAMFAWGLQEVLPVGTGKHNVIIGSVSGYRRFTRKSSFGAGLDIFNKGSLAFSNPDLADRSQISLTQVGLHAGYALHFGAMAILIEPGIYLVTPTDEKSVMYQRIGMRQRIGRRIFLNLTLKSHLTTADHFELGIGYTWP